MKVAINKESIKKKAKAAKPWTDKAGLKSRVREWEKKIKVDVREVHIRDMRNKWASITTDGGRLTLNRELLRHPSDFADYVIVHELIHLKVPNHGKLFKSLMTIHLPKWGNYSNTK